jgi:hypothetical protein
MKATLLLMNLLSHQPDPPGCCIDEGLSLEIIIGEEVSMDGKSSVPFFTVGQYLAC